MKHLLLFDLVPCIDNISHIFFLSLFDIYYMSEIKKSLFFCLFFVWFLKLKSILSKVKTKLKTTFYKTFYKIYRNGLYCALNNTEKCVKYKNITKAKYNTVLRYFPLQ